MAGWAALWLGAVALAAVGVTAVASALIEPRWLAIMVALLVIAPWVAFCATTATTR
jgi:hypothetical protein